VNNQAVNSAVEAGRELVGRATALSEQAAGLEPLAAQTHALRRMLEQLQWQASKIL
jgi:cobyric acid synthase